MSSGTGDLDLEGVPADCNLLLGLICPSLPHLLHILPTILAFWASHWWAFQDLLLSTRRLQPSDRKVTCMMKEDFWTTFCTFLVCCRFWYPSGSWNLFPVDNGGWLCATISTSYIFSILTIALLLLLLFLHWWMVEKLWPVQGHPVRLKSRWDLNPDPNSILFPANHVDSINSLCTIKMSAT